MPSHKPFPKAHAKGMQNLQSAANHPLGDRLAAPSSVRFRVHPWLKMLAEVR
jgi:hypothetical protein